MAAVVVEKAQEWHRLEGGSQTCAWQDLPCFRAVKTEAYGPIVKDVSLVPEYTLKAVVASSNPPEITPSLARSMWSLKDSRKLYAVDGWGAPYFSISDQGHLCVKPQGGAAVCPLRWPFWGAAITSIRGPEWWGGFQAG